MIKKLLWNYRLELAGAVLGALGGWAYWYYIGCLSGTCTITSKPINSTLYGALIGILFLSLFKKEKNTSNS